MTLSNLPTISIGDLIVDEGAGTAVFTVRLSGPAAGDRPVSFGWSYSSENASSSYDFSGNSGQISFATGETEKTIAIPIIDDHSMETAESFQVYLRSVSNALLGKSVATATIIDNDRPIGGPTVSTRDVVVDEAAGYATFDFVLDRPSSTPVTVYFKTVDGSATGGADFSPVVSSVTFAPGEVSKAVKVAIANDVTAEAMETFGLKITSASGASVGDDHATAIIGRNDQQQDNYLPTISINDVVVDEGSGYADFIVQLAGPVKPDQPVSVSWSYSSETASSGYDFGTMSGDLTFAPGEMTKTIRVALYDDNAPERAESFQVYLSGAVNGLVGKSIGTATIIDNDRLAGTPFVSISDAVVDEQSGLATFTLTLDRPSTGIVQVDYTTVSGSAIGGSDFANAAGTVKFGPGQVSKTITIPVINDNFAEVSETFGIQLTKAAGAYLGNKSANAIIGASDTPAANGLPVVTINDVVVDEGQGYAVFTVQLDKPSVPDQQVSVGWSYSSSFASSGYDFGTMSGTLTFAAGEMTKTIRVPIYDDLNLERSAEGFQIYLRSPKNVLIGKDTGTGLIIDNDATPGVPTIVIDNTVVDEKAGTATFSVRLDRPSTGPVTVTYATENGSATAGSDFAYKSGQITFAPGQVLQTITVSIIDDAAAEQNETFAVRLTNASGGTIRDGHGTVVIGGSDLPMSDGLPMVTINDVMVNEGAGVAVFTVQLSKQSLADRPASVNFTYYSETASSGYDFSTISGSLAFAPGETTKTIVVPINDDTDLESVEAFQIRLTGAQNATIGDNTGIGSIVDNDRVGTQALVGSSGNDEFVVTSASQIIYETAKGGIDTVHSSISFSLDGTNIENVTLTGSANLRATGDGLANTLVGNSGSNILIGNAGNDSIDGGAGSDTAVYSGRRGDYVVIRNQNGTVSVADKRIGGDGHDTVKNVEFFQLSDGTFDLAQFLVAPSEPQPPTSQPPATEPPVTQPTTSVTVYSNYTAPADIIRIMAGGAGDVKLTGNKLGNSITGNTGKNVINGGLGNDELAGGKGQDTFVFNTKLGTSKTDRTVNFDTVRDFNTKDDSLYLDNAIFKKLGKGAASKPIKLNKDFFLSGTKAKDKNDYVLYNKKTGVLSYDADGSGKGEAVEFALLKTKPTLKHDGFFVI
jgi:hypothetical protein